MEKVTTPDQSLENKILLAPYEYLLQVSGKNFRVKLIKAFNHWLQVPHDKLIIIIEVVQMLHEASLLIDDIEDASDLRRGMPVAHHIFGLPQTINSGNYVYFLALQKALLLDHPHVPHIFAEQLLELHKGQGFELYWRDHHQCPSEQEYLQMASRKTGGLFNLAVRFMQLFSENKSQFEALSRNLGLMFQITDDYANLKSSKLKNVKGFADDLSEGKFSFPIIHAIKSQPDNDLVSNILRQKTQKEDVKSYCISLMDSYGSFIYTRQCLVKLVNEINQQIRDLGENEQLSAIVNKWIDVYNCEE